MRCFIQVSAAKENFSGPITVIEQFSSYLRPKQASLFLFLGWHFSQIKPLGVTWVFLSWLAFYFTWLRQMRANGHFACFCCLCDHTYCSPYFMTISDALLFFTLTMYTLILIYGFMYFTYKHTRNSSAMHSLYIYIYIYIYMCVCVCVCVSASGHMLKIANF